jgi:uncharacterized repeat protein (TIGR03803 family)
MSLISCSRAGVAVTPATSAAWGPSDARPDTDVIAPLYDFGGHGGKDGTIGDIGGYAGLIGSATALYGTAPGGGDLSCAWQYFTIAVTGCGVVYKLAPQSGSSKYEETLLHVFKGPPDDGAGLFGSLFMTKTGEIYGTTYEGGKNNAGVIFKMNASGSGYSVIHNFGGSPDGAYPWGGIIEVNGTLYGVTTGGGTHKHSACDQFGFGSPEKYCGTLYSLKEKTGAEKVLHDFGAGSNDGINPLFPLIYENGVIYGTTTLGLGTNADGTVFAVSPTTGKERILSTPGSYDFPDSPVLAIKGVLYGEAEHVSGGPCCWGAIFSLDISSGSQNVLYDFQKSTFDDGYFPSTGLLYHNGVLYGSTIDGGSSTKCGTSSPRGCGTFFSLKLDGAVFSVLASFSGGNGGEYPEDKPLYSAGALYGTTILGGAQDDGIAFKIPL